MTTASPTPRQIARERGRSTGPAGHAQRALDLRHHDPVPAGEIVAREVRSPLGTLLLIGDGARLRHLELPSSKRPLAIDPTWRRSSGAYPEVAEQLDRYFAGSLREFSLALDLVGTPFQRRVWELLASIPFGATWTYGELARRVGNPTASRAVGAANGRNPIPIILPCHRVIGSDGSLVGFGGGLDAKRRLLELEASACQPGLF
jgi:methylated-DNA-[protein]-cysteine S-methyltransferase